MQAKLPSNYDFLNLADPEILFNGATADLDSSAIRQALDLAIEQNAQVPGEPSTRRRLRVLAEAGRILLSDPRRRADAIHLSLVAAPELSDTAPLVGLRIRALLATNDRKAAVIEANRVLSSPSLAPTGRHTLVNLLRRLGLEKAIPVRVEDLKDYWLNDEAAMRDPFADITVEGPSPQIDRMGKIVAKLNGCDSKDEAAFLARIRWGAEIHRRMIYLKRLRIETLKKPAHTRTPGEITALAISRAVHQRISFPDFTPVTESIASGRSVVLTSAHAGLTTVKNVKDHLPGIPHSTVAVNATVPKRPQDFHLAVGAQDMVIGFVKLAKLMRKSPRLVRTYPDGPNGELMEINVCGRQIKIGRGTAVLAYLGRAKIYFTRSLRTENGFAFTLQPGPDPVLFETQEEFERAFVKFYEGCLEGIVMGAPEDMVLKGGFWPQLEQ